jgi:hypothetical protein
MKNEFYLKTISSNSLRIFLNLNYKKLLLGKILKLIRIQILSNIYF